ncbi:hypothetical protein Undi14_00720 [Undibacterium sp. 14-3-2]|uniref:hypothetical protein n=1 Tax=Undibacterium sp. 14-3-2 TaxID=2800129 RepID=UPI001905A0B1|nr:hypothetical protein [Undibacterium sp. 14-3-2]MBK1888537.1 hypothetical protein [Undibacterium sp. 14-3-2]
MENIIQVAIFSDKTGHITRPDHSSAKTESTIPPVPSSDKMGDTTRKVLSWARTGSITMPGHSSDKTVGITLPGRSWVRTAAITPLVHFWVFMVNMLSRMAQRIWKEALSVVWIASAC